MNIRCMILLAVATTVVAFSNSADGQHSPSGSIVSPSSSCTAYTGIAVTFTLTGTDAGNDLRLCEVYLNGDFQTWAPFSGAASGSTASWTHAFNTAGAYTVIFVPLDWAGNYGTGVNWTVGVETHNPSITISSPGSPATAYTGIPITFTATGADDAGDLRLCEVYLNGDFQTWALFSGAASGSTASWTHSFNIPGTYPVTLLPLDSAGNYGSGVDWTVVVEWPAVADGRPPTVYASSPHPAYSIMTCVGTTIQFTIRGQDEDGNLSFSQVYLQESGGSPELQENLLFSDRLDGYVDWAYTFTEPGTYTVTAKAWDLAGNENSNPPALWNVLVRPDVPTISIVSPSSPIETSVGETVTLTVFASAYQTVSSIEWLLGGQQQRVRSVPREGEECDVLDTWGHTFDTPGIYVVEVWVEDWSGQSCAEPAVWSVTVAGPDTYAVTISSTAGGSVTEPGEGTFEYDPNSVATLRATPDQGYHFTHWSGSISSTNNPLQLTMNNDYSLTANFAADAATYTLSISSGTGGFVMEPGEGPFEYDANSVATLRATPDQGYHFTHWSGSVSSMGNPLSLTMDRDHHVTANFASDLPDEQVTLGIDSTPGGSVSLPGEGAFPYHRGSTVILKATADQGYCFTGWWSEVPLTGNPLNLTLEHDYDVRANFATDANPTRPTVHRESPDAETVQAYVRQTIVFEMHGQDAGGDLSLSEVYLDGVFQEWARYSDGSDSIATWSHTFNTPGTYSVRASVLDQAGHGGDDITWTVEVTDGSPQASIESPTNYIIRVTPGETITFTLHGTDPDGDLRLSEVYLDEPDGPFELAAEIEYSHGYDSTAVWEHTFETLGIYRVAFNCVDRNGNYGPGGGWTVEVAMKPEQAFRLAQSGEPTMFFGAWRDGGHTGNFKRVWEVDWTKLLGMGLAALQMQEGIWDFAKEAFSLVGPVYKEDDPMKGIHGYVGTKFLRCWGAFSSAGWAQADVDWYEFGSYWDFPLVVVTRQWSIPLVVEGTPGRQAELWWKYDVSHTAIGVAGTSGMLFYSDPLVYSGLQCTLRVSPHDSFEWASPIGPRTAYEVLPGVLSVPLTVTGTDSRKTESVKIATVPVGEPFSVSGEVEHRVWVLLRPIGDAWIESWISSSFLLEAKLVDELPSPATLSSREQPIAALAVQAAEPMDLPRVQNTTQSTYHGTIQAAIDEAIDGDRIEVGPGTFSETIDLQGKAITLCSSDGPSFTTINGNGAPHVIQCVSGEGSGTVIDGFTITAGDANDTDAASADCGGGMLNDNSSPTVTRCLFSTNTACNGAGMANTNGSSPTVTHCTFRRNSAGDSGGAIWNTEHSSPTLINCVFTRNEAANGGALANDGTSSPILANCTFTGNEASTGGALANDGTSSPILTNCILWADVPEEISVDDSSLVTVTYSDVQGGWPGTGNIDTDPAFAEPNLIELGLAANSPCIDAGDNTVPGLPATDMAAGPRVVNGDADNVAVVDMGAYEYCEGRIRNVTRGTRYVKIQRAIDEATDGDEIEVSPGTYKEAIDFKGKAITLRGSRGSKATTLSGNGAYHVVKCVSGEDANTVLEGFTITGGSANGEAPDDGGGGMINFNSNPTVNDCIFAGNSAVFGGGMLNYQNSNPSVTHCTFRENTAVYGGGLYNHLSNPTVIGCVFTANTADSGGAGISDFTSSPRVTNCVFMDNATEGNGGAMLILQNSGPTLINCTFAGNSASDGIAFACDSTEQASPSTVQVANCILWDGGGEIMNADNSQIHITYSDIQGGWPGAGNIDADPLFVDAEWNLCLLPGSPCVDAADNSVPGLPETDLAGRPRLVDNPDRPDTGSGTAPIVDMGAIEWSQPPESEP